MPLCWALPYSRLGALHPRRRRSPAYRGEGPLELEGGVGLAARPGGRGSESLPTEGPNVGWRGETLSGMPVTVQGGT